MHTGTEKDSGQVPDITIPLSITEHPQLAVLIPPDDLQSPLPTQILLSGLDVSSCNKVSLITVSANEQNIKINVYF
jgi:hypothetical protein